MLRIVQAGILNGIPACFCKAFQMRRRLRAAYFWKFSQRALK